MSEIILCQWQNKNAQAFLHRNETSDLFHLKFANDCLSLATILNSLTTLFYISRCHRENVAKTLSAIQLFKTRIWTAEWKNVDRFQWKLSESANNISKKDWHKKNEATKNPTKGGNRNEMSTQKVLKCKSESDRHSIRDNTLGLRSMKCGKQFEWCQRMHNDYREFLFLSIFNMRLSKRALLLRIALRHLQFMG